MTSHNLLTSPTPEATPADLAVLAREHRERMATCECPSCIPPRIGDLLPDVLAEMRRREGR